MYTILISIHFSSNQKTIYKTWQIFIYKNQLTTETIVWKGSLKACDVKVQGKL